MKKNNLDTLELEQKIEIVLINLRELYDGALFESNIKTSYRLLGELKDVLTRSDKHASQIIVIENKVIEKLTNSSSKKIIEILKEIKKENGKYSDFKNKLKESNINIDISLIEFADFIVKLNANELTEDYINSKII